jgi:Domain of unknown function (DUF4177)
MNVGRFCFPALTVAALLGTAISSREPAFGQDTKDKEKTTRPLVKWEYKVIASSSSAAQMEDALNKLGEEGWECVGTVTPVVAVTPTGGFGGGGKAKSATNLILKRPKQ